MLYWGEVGCAAVPSRVNTIFDALSAAFLCGRRNPLIAQLGRSPSRDVAHTCMGAAQLSGGRKASSVGRCLLDCGGLSRP